MYNPPLDYPFRSNALFERLDTLPPDAIIRLIGEYQSDPRDFKIDLGIGVYKTAEGDTPIPATVKRAERMLLESQATKAYIGSAGPADFNEAMRDLTFAGTVDDDRVAMLQTPGGSGSLSVAAGVILRATGSARVWYGGPTWANHVPLLGGAGLEMNEYPYYDTETHGLRTEAMLDALREIPKGDVLLMHACCHNPTGVDPTEEEWRAIADIVVDSCVPLQDASVDLKNHQDKIGPLSTHAYVSIVWMTITTVAEILADRGVKLYIHPSHNVPGDTTAHERLDAALAEYKRRVAGV